MRNIKKITAMLIAVAMVLSLISISAFAAPQTINPEFKITDLEGNPVTSVKTGDTVRVSMYIPAASYGSSVFWLSYDSSKVTVSNLVRQKGLNGNIVSEQQLIKTSGTIEVAEGVPVLSVDATIGTVGAGTLDVISINSASMNTEGDVEEILVGSTKATITTVEASVITGVTNPDKIANRSYGTTFEALGLPETVSVAIKATASGTTGTYDCPVIWDAEGYSDTSLEEQAIAGTLNPVDPITNAETPFAAEIKVQLQPFGNDDITEMTAIPAVTFPVVADAADDAVYTAEEIEAAFIAVAPQNITVKKGEVEDTYAVNADNVTVSGTLKKNKLTSAEDTNKATITVTLNGESANKLFNLTSKTITAEATVVPAEVKDENLSFEIKPQNLTNSASLSVVVKDANEAYAGKNVSVVVSAGDKSVTLPKEGGEAMTLAGTSSTFRLGKLSDIFGDDVAVDTVVTFEVKLDGAAIINPDGTSSVSSSVRKPSSSNSGSGIPNNPGSSTGESKTYNIKTTESENGTFTVQSTAKAGDVVTITTKPDEGYKTDVITVKTTNNTDVKVDGKKFTMPSSDVTVSVTFVEGVEEPEPSGDFTDVPSGNWAYEAIMNLKNLGIVNGVTETTFNPDGDVTRAEFAKMVAQLFSLKATSATSAFTDCTADDWYTPYVIAVAEAGYVKGMDDSYFGADEKITRQDICTVLGRVLDAKAGEGAALSFTDADQIADYAQEYVLALVDMGVLKGYEDGTFLPAANATRAEAAKIIDGVTKLDNQVVKDAMAKLNGTDANADDNKDANTDDNKDAADGENADDNKDAE